MVEVSAGAISPNLVDLTAVAVAVCDFHDKLMLHEVDSSHGEHCNEYNVNWEGVWPLSRERVLNKWRSRLWSAAYTKIQNKHWALYSFRQKPVLYLDSLWY